MDEQEHVVSIDVYILPAYYLFLQSRVQCHVGGIAWLQLQQAIAIEQCCFEVLHGLKRSRTQQEDPLVTWIQLQDATACLGCLHDTTDTSHVSKDIGPSPAHVHILADSSKLVVRYSLAHHHLGHSSKDTVVRVLYQRGTGICSKPMTVSFPQKRE